MSMFLCILVRAGHTLLLSTKADLGLYCTVCPLAYMQAMSAADDDSTLTQLATAWVNLYLGGAKVEEAFFIFQELGDKYNWTVSNATVESIRKQMPTSH